MSKKEIIERIIELIEEDIVIILDTLSHVNQWSIYNSERKFHINYAQRNIEFMLDMRTRYISKLNDLNKHSQH